MKISTKGRYGARVMLELALDYGKGPVQAKEIARRQELSPKYIEHLIASLKAGGLVKAVRGVHGGYVLSKPPGHIRLIDILGVLEGSVGVVECLDNPDVCSRQKVCVTREIWAEMKEAITGILASTTLENMVQRMIQKQQGTVPMYYI